TVRNSAEEADSLRARAAADGAGASPKQPALRPDPPQFGVCRQSPGFEKPFEQECTVLAWLERGNDQNEMLLPFDCLRRGVAADAHARSWRADEHSFLGEAGEPTGIRACGLGVRDQLITERSAVRKQLPELVACFRHMEHGQQ